MIDTHTHLYLPEFSDDGSDAAVRRALDAGVSHMVMPNVDAGTVEPLRQLHDRFPDVTSMAMGLHPTEIKESWRDDLSDILPLTELPGCVAVGEIGMDLYWDATFRDQQMLAFEMQTSHARDLGLPVIIHCREALDETLEVLSGFHGNMPVLVFHSFTGSPADVDRIRTVADAWFGINGVVTFKNAGTLHEAVPEITASRILLETDSPYLAPVPKRGKRNESSFLPHIRDRVSELLGMTPPEAGEITDLNARTVFNLQ